MQSLSARDFLYGYWNYSPAIGPPYDESEIPFANLAMKSFLRLVMHMRTKYAKLAGRAKKKHKPPVKISCKYRKSMHLALRHSGHPRACLCRR
jgi:hypothetical protein